MKVIQSFWSGNKTNLNNNYGWLSNKHHWISWILSANQLSKHHSQLELYTDSFGYDILIKNLKLPYTKVHVVLDELNSYHPNLWAISKIKTYELQNEPFLHVDGDVFVRDSLLKNNQKASLITQNLERTTDYYTQMWKNIKPNLNYIPQEFNAGINNEYACNMGIVGGNNISFFKEYAKKSFEFVDKNREAWESINCLNFNIFFEQVLFYRLSKNKKLEINYHFEKISDDNNYIGFGDFDNVPDKTYLHLLGNYKRNAGVCRKMETYTMKYYPKYYSNLMTLLGEKDSVSKNSKNLISRDLFYEGMPILFDRLIKFKLPFYLKKMTEVDLKESDEYIKTVEFDGKHEIYKTDEIDFMILNELKTHILYNNFI